MFDDVSSRQKLNSVVDSLVKYAGTINYTVKVAAGQFRFKKLVIVIICSKLNGVRSFLDSTIARKWFDVTGRSDYSK